MTTILQAALEYLDQGIAVIPIRPETKRPYIKWMEYQHRLPTEEEVTGWWDTYPDAMLAIVTGAVSGIVIVDCDNDDAIHAAFDAGMRSPVRVKTKHGMHLYFRHPMDGRRRGPRAGVNVRAEHPDWPRIPGLDFRGDGSYALMPPSNGYTFDVSEGYGFDRDDMPVWKDWVPEIRKPDVNSEFGFDTLDLSEVRPMGDFISEWDRTAAYVAEHFPAARKIPTGQGNGRNERVMRYASECIMEGLFGPELRLRCIAFMKEFFVDPLPKGEFEATCASMEQAERRNHPERFDAQGQYIPKVIEHVPEPVKPVRRLILMSDARDLLASSKATRWLMEPWIKRGTIVQVYGFSGHGKSTFLQHALSALCAGQKYFGPFEIHEPARVLYMNYEEGPGTIARRLIDLESLYGKTADRLQIWAPFIEGKDAPLSRREGLGILGDLIVESRADVIAIDTIRTAYPGLEENDADSWSRINQLSLKLRNAGHAVIWLHHGNKPSEQGRGIGSSAGSTNQLTTLETQIRIAQVYPDKETAAINSGLWDGDYEVPVFPQLQAKAGPDYRLAMVMEVMYAKVREWTETHDRVQWIGFAHHKITGALAIVSSRSTKQRAKDMALNGALPADIALTLGRSLVDVRNWLGL